MTILRRAAMLLTLVVGAGLVFAQGGTLGWQVEAISAFELVDADERTPIAWTAPDGRHVAYQSRVDDSPAICAVDVTTSDPPTCLAHPLPAPWFVPHAAIWSRDGNRLAAIGDINTNGGDNDLYVFDFAAETVTNLTDDGYDGPLYGDDDFSSAIIEWLMAWSWDGTQIALARQTWSTDNEEGPIEVAVVDVDSRDVRELVALPVFGESGSERARVNALAWSPDGATLAIVVFQPSDPDNLLSNGLWLVDVESGDVDFVITPALAKAALREFNDAEEEPPLVGLANWLSWSPDGSRILMWIGAQGIQGFRPSVFWLDVETHELHTPSFTPPPYYDATSAEEHWSSFPHSTEDLVWSPDGRYMIINGRERPHLAAENIIAIDPEMNTERLLGVNTVVLLDVETGESAVVGHMGRGAGGVLFPQWGPDNHVLINGYHLQLAQE